MDHLSTAFSTVLHPQRVVSRLQAEDSRDYSLAIGGLLGVSNGFLPWTLTLIPATADSGFGVRMLQVILCIGIGVMTTLFGLIIFSEFLKWTTGFFKKEPASLFRAIVTYAMLPVLFANLLSLVLPIPSLKLLLILGSLAWSMILMILMIVAYKGIKEWQAALAVLVTMVITHSPLLLLWSMYPY